jgi:hypothetical protein
MVDIKQGMADQTSFDARAGAAKRPQTSFLVKDGMKDMTTMSGIGPGSTGPDASSANPLDPEPLGKSVPRVTSTPWDSQKTGDGDSYDPSIGTAALNEAVISGSHLPVSTTEQSASGANPTDPNA